MDNPSLDNQNNNPVPQAPIKNGAGIVKAIFAAVFFLLAIAFLGATAYSFANGVPISKLISVLHSDKFAETAPSSPDRSVFRTDIKAFIVSEIDDDNGEPSYYILRFYSDSAKISDLVAVATSSVEIAEDGTMSVQLEDDQHTRDGDLYASVYLSGEVIDPRDAPTGNTVDVGVPCIVTATPKVTVCDYFVLDIDTSDYGSSDQATSYRGDVVALGNQVKGFFEMTNRRVLLAGATQSDIDLRRPRPTPPKPPTTSTTSTKPPAKPSKPAPKPKPYKKPAKPAKPKPGPKDKKPTKPKEDTGPKGYGYDPVKVPPGFGEPPTKLPPLDDNQKVFPPYDIPTPTDPKLPPPPDDGKGLDMTDTGAAGGIPPSTPPVEPPVPPETGDGTPASPECEFECGTLPPDGTTYDKPGTPKGNTPPPPDTESKGTPSTGSKGGGKSTGGGKGESLLPPGTPPLPSASDLGKDVGSPLFPPLNL